MKHKVSELEGAQLDYWVAKAAGGEPRLEPSGCWVCPKPGRGLLPFEPSTNWAHGGPIIERERITINAPGVEGYYHEWGASIGGKRDYLWPGATPLIAAMRAYVASRFGEELELP